MTTGSTLTLMRMGWREQLRRPILIVLLVVLPVIFITRAIAVTETTPRSIGLPGGDVLITTMRDVHGAVMAGITVAILAGLVGVLLMQSALDADRRLVVAGMEPRAVVLGRIGVMAATVGLVVAVSLVVTAFSFTPQSWAWFALGTGLTAATYGAVGAIAGASLGRLGATYLMFLMPMLDLGILQNPMFGDGTPDGGALFLPGYGPARAAIDGAFGPGFDGAGALALAAAWIVGLTMVATSVLLRSIRPRHGH